MDAMNFCTLVGMARTGFLSARTVAALDVLKELGEIRDYRDGMPDGLEANILCGYIRTDARWSLGAEQRLVALLN